MSDSNAEKLNRAELAHIKRQLSQDPRSPTYNPFVGKSLEFLVEAHRALLGRFNRSTDEAGHLSRNDKFAGSYTAIYSMLQSEIDLQRDTAEQTLSARRFFHNRFDR